jgi:hypothetical protein
MRRLDQFLRSVEERHQPEADFDAIVRHEHAISPQLGGRTVMDDRRRAKSRQLDLF